MARYRHRSASISTRPYRISCWRASKDWTNSTNENINQKIIFLKQKLRKTKAHICLVFVSGEIEFFVHCIYRFLKNVFTSFLDYSWNKKDNRKSLWTFSNNKKNHLNTLVKIYIYIKYKNSFIILAVFLQMFCLRFYFFQTFNTSTLNILWYFNFYAFYWL